MDKVKVVSKKQAVVRGEGTSYKIKNFIMKDLSPNVSLAISELNGESPKTMNTASDRIYYFTEGGAEFIFNQVNIKVERDSALYIPKNTEYKMKGKFKAVLINAPAFNIANERHSD